jgi:hypothetical protein
MILAHFEIGGIQPDIRIAPFQRPVAKRFNDLI